MTHMLTGKSSPWGTVQEEEQIAEGIIYVSIASHGGIWVARELLPRITKEMRDFAKYWSGSSQWFEEDCAAQCVVVSFPEYFPAEQVEAAWATVRRYVTKEGVMVNVTEALRDASGALDYAIDALEAPAGASIRDTARELKEARETVADMLAALERIVEVEGNGGSAIGMRMIALAAIKAAKGEA